MAEDFCRLCLRPVDKANCAEIKKDEAKQEMFSEFFPELNIDLSANPTLCNECALNLEVSSNFKQGVLENEARIESELAKSKSKAKKKKIDLKTLLDAETKNELKSDLSICRTCLAICKDPSIRLYEAKTNVMPYSFVKKMCVQIFELEFTNSDKPVMCDECWETLQNAYDFRKNCLKTEKKITSYCQENKLTILGEIDLKKLNSLPANEDDSEMSDDDDFGDVDIKEEIFDPNDPDLSNPGSSSSSLQHVKLKKEEDGASGSVSVKSESGMDDEDEDMGDHPDLVDPNNLKSEEDGEGDDIDTKMEVGDTVKVDPEAAGAAGPSGQYSIAELGRDVIEICRNLRNHQEIHKPSSERPKCTCCGKCSKEYTGKQSLLDHKLRVHENTFEMKSFSCSHYSYNTIYKTNIPKHQETHKVNSETQRFICAECSKVIKGKRSLLDHIFQVHKRSYEIKSFSCSQCGYKTTNRTNFRIHQEIHIPNSEMFTCAECSKVLKGKQNFLGHILHVHKRTFGIKSFSCFQCAYKTTRKNNFEKHQEIHKPNSERLIFTCSQCVYKTTYKTNLQRHQEIHKPNSERQMFTCSECSKVFTGKEGLLDHKVRVHKRTYEIKSFSCSHCGYKTINETNLRRHQDIHKPNSERQMYTCAECSKVFTAKSSLLDHIQRVHKRIYEINFFSCSLCAYKTTIKAYLRRHQESHKPNSERQMFTCEECSNVYTGERDLLDHLLRVHKKTCEIKRFSCSHCGYKTKNKINLPIHQKIHTLNSERQMFTCAKCLKVYTTKGSLLRHILRVHRRTK